MSSSVRRCAQRIVLWLVLPISLALALPAAALATAPGATTGSATAITSSGATLDGTVNPEGQPSTAYQFTYGLATSNFCTGVSNAGSTTVPVSAVALGYSDSTDHAVSMSVSGLAASTQYCFRIDAQNSSSGTNYAFGSLVSFMTSAANPPVVSATGATSITQHSADLTANINPEGQAGTQYSFAYDLASSMWCTNGSGTPSYTPTETLGFNDSTAHAVSATATVEPGNSYCYEPQASSDGGSAAPTFATFSTPSGPPVLSTGNATPVHNNGETLNGLINPNGQDVLASFQFAVAGSSFCTSGGSDTTSVEGTNPHPLGYSDTSQHPFSVSPPEPGVNNLTPGTSYCYRLVAYDDSYELLATGTLATFTTAPGYTLTVSVSGTPWGEVADDSATTRNPTLCGFAGGPCKETGLAYGQSVVLSGDRLQNDGGGQSLFTGFSGACSAVPTPSDHSDTNCNLTITGDEQVGVSFAMGTFCKTASGLPLPAASPSCPRSAAPAGTGTAHVGSIKTSGTTASVPESCAAGGASCTVTNEVTVTETLKGGKVTAVSAIAVSSAKKKTKTTKKTVVLGKTKVTIAAGKKKTVKVSLNGAGKKLLAKNKHLKTKLKITSNRAGGKTGTVASKTVTFKQPTKTHKK